MSCLSTGQKMSYGFSALLIRFPPELGGLGGNRLSLQIPKLQALTPTPLPTLGEGKRKSRKHR